MQISLIAACLLTAFISCRNRQADGSSLSGLPSFITDSLNKHLKADSLFRRGAFAFYVGQENGQDFGLYQLSDSATVVYQNQKHIWLATDTLSFPLHYVQTADLNGDSCKDIIVTYNATGIGGNGQNVSLIYYPNIRVFKHNPYFDLPNIFYDAKASLVCSAWWGSSNHPQNKMTYNLTGDSLIFHEGVTYYLDEQTQGETGAVEFYKMQDGRKVTIRNVKGKATRIFDIFTAALWDTSDQ